jgi:integrase
MGGERKTNKSAKHVKVSKGIEIRHWQKSNSIRIIFCYKGIECRETLRLEPTSGNIKYAERLRGEILNAIERGSFSYANYFPNSKRAKLFGHVASNVTIGELLSDFLKQAENTLQLSTYIGYKKVCNAHLMNTFGNIHIKELTPAFIRKWISSLNLTAKTIRNILIPLRSILDEALNDDIIQRNPLDRVVLTRVINKKTIKSDYEPDPFDINEINAILQNAKDQAKNFFQFALFTGLRPSELIALEWRDIDWVNGLVRVKRAVVEKQEKCTKTEAGERDVMLLPPAFEALQAQKIYTYLEGKRIFHNPRTGQPWETHAQIRKTCWKYILKKAGIRYRNPYQTRHTYASMMLSAGENMLWLARQMGHRDTEMIIKTYAKWIPDPSSKVGYKPVNDWGIVLHEKAATK